MSDHLPECGANDGSMFCICDALRACEQRSYTLGIEVGKHDGWIAGHAAGVQAAREAVADLTPFVFAYQTWISGDYGYDEGPWVKKENALAAIEALGGER